VPLGQKYGALFKSPPQRGTKKVCIKGSPGKIWGAPSFLGNGLKATTRGLFLNPGVIIKVKRFFPGNPKCPGTPLPNYPLAQVGLKILGPG